jgi:peptidoglycan/LPS O-acetylase OafA/YrhL
MESRGSHLRYVDGLRAIAILAVIVYHAISEARWPAPWLSAPLEPAPTWWFATLASKGAHGVDLFFVISGFCLSYPALARLRSADKSTFDIRGFFAKRIARIVPPYYAAIVIVIAAVLLAGSFGLHRPSAVASDFTPLSVLQQLLFLDRHVDLVNSSFWTLTIELRWYLAFPLLLMLYVRSTRAFYALLVACVIAFNFTQLRAIDIGTLPGFMLGIVAADWQLRGHRFARYALPGLLVTLDIALLLEPFASAPSRFGVADETGFYVQTNIGWQLASFCFVVAAGRVGWLRRTLEVPVLCAVGVCAYGIYLVHQPIISAWDRNAGANAGPLLNFTIAVALALAGGFLFSYLAEQPFLRERSRTRIIRALEKPIARAFRFMGVPESLQLVPAAPEGSVLDRATLLGTLPPAAQRELHPSGAGDLSAS